MPHTLFISDLHLCSNQTHCVQLFKHFIKNIAPKAEALYILGDLFEYWAGDDDIEAPFYQEITCDLRTLSKHGTRLYIMPGNRDLLMGKVLEQASGATLLKDPTKIDLYGTLTLLSHGDVLCSDDIAYQTFRKQVHNAEWQQQFLAQPLAQRKTQIEQMRMRSENDKQLKSREIMEVNAETVAEFLREHNYPRLIHGHTHRPLHSLHHLDGYTCERWVLGDWDKTGNALHCDATGCQYSMNSPNSHAAI